MDIKIRCIDIVDGGVCQPRAVLVADIVVNKNVRPDRYVLISAEERVALSELGVCDYDKASSIMSERFGVPILLVGDVFSADGRRKQGDLSEHAVSWQSPGSVWVFSVMAEHALRELLAWRANNRQWKSIPWAPTPLTMVAVQALVHGAGTLIPNGIVCPFVNGDPRRSVFGVMVDQRVVPSEALK